MAYVSQEAWIFSSSVRDNVLFGLEYEPEWYDTVIEACALKNVRERDRDRKTEIERDREMESKTDRMNVILFYYLSLPLPRIRILSSLLMVTSLWWERGE